MTKWWLEPHPDLMEESMSETKLYLTAVFECPGETLFLNTQTPWGKVVALSVGNAMQQSEIYEDMLCGIADDGCHRCAEAAQKAIDTGAAYVNSQIDRKSLKPMSPPPETEQLDLVSAIDAAGAEG